MNQLDLDYITTVLSDAAAGSSGSFAELFAATYQKQYAFTMDYLKDEFSALDAMQEAYVFALTNIGLVMDAALFVPWLCRAVLRACLKVKYPGENIDALPVKVGHRVHTMRQLLSLPLTGSQALILKYFFRMSLKDIASYMEMSTFAVWRASRKARRTLSKAGEAA